jgi:hypothetical protein
MYPSRAGKRQNVRDAIRIRERIECVGNRRKISNNTNAVSTVVGNVKQQGENNEWYRGKKKVRQSGPVSSGVSFAM